MTTATISAAPSARAFAWKATLLAIPLVVATAGFFVWRAELNRLASRNIPSFGQVPAFRLTNQNGQPFGSADLENKIWIADFIFTTCPGPCPIISSRMSELQKPFENTDVRLVSFTVDPEKDTPEVLRNYAEKHHAQKDRWNFLTGSKSAIYDLSAKGFKLAAIEGNEETGMPIHSTRMVLVDRRGQIRGYYDALAADSVTKLVADTRHLLREQPR
ncbi:MAG TPA: SCO family protein [Chthoniobacterales bacterium]|nr:SCO family protein [Chthoniobacterales bacterium]